MIRVISIILLLLILGLVILYFVKTKGKEYTIFLIATICWFIFIPGKIVFKLVSYLIIFISIKIYAFFKFKRNYGFKLFFGIPGSGKSTISAWHADIGFKRQNKVYSNTPILGAIEIEKEDIGKYKIEDGLLLLDECGSDFNSRNFKSMTQEQIKWFKLHRHYKVDIICFSQYWDDIDKILRNLATELYLVKSSIIPFFIKTKKIGKRIGIDKETKEIIDEYYFIPFGGFYYFAPRVWKLFKTDEKVELPEKDFKIYTNEEKDILNLQENVEASESESTISEGIQALARRVE